MMPRYDYECPACLRVAEIAHRMSESPRVRCPACSSVMRKAIFTAPAVKAAVDSGWESENGGRGRYISQLQRVPGPEGSDPTAFARSQSEAIDKAKRRGFTVTKAR